MRTLSESIRILHFRHTPFCGFLLFRFLRYPPCHFFLVTCPLLSLFFSPLFPNDWGPWIIWTYLVLIFYIWCFLLSVFFFFCLFFCFFFVPCFGCWGGYFCVCRFVELYRPPLFPGFCRILFRCVFICWAHFFFALLRGVFFFVLSPDRWMFPRLFLFLFFLSTCCICSGFFHVMPRPPAGALFVSGVSHDSYPFFLSFGPSFRSDFPIIPTFANVRDLLVYSEQYVNLGAFFHPIWVGISYWLLGGVFGFSLSLVWFFWGSGWVAFVMLALALVFSCVPLFGSRFVFGLSWFICVFGFRVVLISPVWPYPPSFFFVSFFFFFLRFFPLLTVCFCVFLRCRYFFCCVVWVFAWCASALIRVFASFFFFSNFVFVRSR